MPKMLTDPELLYDARMRFQGASGTINEIRELLEEGNLDDALGQYGCFRGDKEIGELFCSWIEDEKVRTRCIEIEKELDLFGRGREIFNVLLSDMKE